MMSNVVQEISEQRAESWETVLGEYISCLFFVLFCRSSPQAFHEHSILNYTDLSSHILCLVLFSC